MKMQQIETNERGKYNKRTIEERFWSKVDKKGEFECWNWIGAISGNGYGHIIFDEKIMQSHRISWIIHNGDIPNGLYTLHKCDNRKCVNPKHLFLGTQQDNMTDMIEKGRSPDNEGENNPNCKLNWDIVHKIRERWSNGESQVDLFKEFNIPKETINHVITNHTWYDENYKHIHRSNKEGEKHWKHKLTWKEVNEMREKYKEGKISHRKLSNEYNISLSNVCYILNNKAWFDKNYKN